MVLKEGYSAYALTEDGWKKITYVSKQVRIRGVTFVTLVGVDEKGEAVLFPRNVTTDFQEALKANEVETESGRTEET